ncbi:MAG: hypothetical protein C0456_12830 [Hyphomonas sp.]|uniref:hypothetical protein n=1 Tax=Hyphomonas sp. TaxID=87 RepID=UPI001D7B71A1|nr:hypothetical protein [Hyphomonas sp.]MBA4227508.1 hypothetical protein [Hyphomonas sp.]
MTVGDYYALACIGLGAFLCIVGAFAILNKMGIAGRFSAKVPWLGEMSAPASSMILVAGIFVLIVPPHLNPQLFVSDKETYELSEFTPGEGDAGDINPSLVIDAFWALPDEIANFPVSANVLSRGEMGGTLSSFLDSELQGRFGKFQSTETGSVSLPLSRSCGIWTTDWYSSGANVRNPCPEDCTSGVPVASDFRLSGYPPHLERQITFQCFKSQTNLTVPVRALQRALQTEGP